MQRWATIDGDYRYDLGRQWLPLETHPRMMFLMCNPSVADFQIDDPTIRRCIGFAADHGCGSIEVVNLWPYRATQPKDLWAALASGKISVPVHAKNTEFICRAAQRATRRVMAFGTAPVERNEAYVRDVVQLVEHCGPLECLGTTDAGIPLHPLARGKHAIRNGTKLKPWTWPKEPA